jgi:type II secretory pathway predicted ATPase ExeA
VKPQVFADSPPYWAHFGLTASSFDSANGSRFFYLGRSHSAVQTQMTDAIVRGEGLIVLTGASGTGKTTLCRFLLDSLSVPAVVSFGAADTSFTYETFLRRVLVDFGADAPATGIRSIGQAGAADLLARLTRFLESRPSSPRPIVVLDDAHQVPVELLTELRRLGNRQTSRGKLLQLILVGQPSLESLFEEAQSSQLEQRVARWCRLRPLLVTEIEPYIRHKLGAGPTETEGELPLSPAALRLLGELSKGNPGVLDQLFDRALQAAFEHGVRRISRRVMIQSGKRLNLEVPASGYPTTRVAVLTAAAVVTVAIALLMLRTMPGKPADRPAQQVAAAGLSPSPRVPKPAAIPTPSAGASTAASNSSTAKTEPVEQLPSADSFVIILASFRSRQLAAESAKELSGLGFPAFVRSDDPWYVVVVGPYLTVEEARDTTATISSRQFPDARIQRIVVSR